MDIKDIWKNQPDQGSSLEEEELERLLQGKTESLLETIKRNARIEHFFNITVSPIFLIWLIFQKEWALLAVSTAGLTFLVVFYWNLYKKLWAIEPSDNTKLFLYEFYETFKDFLRRYIYGLIIILPLSFTIGIYISGGEDPFNTVFKLKNIGLIVLTLSVLGASVYGMVYLFYGKYMKKLKELIKSLEE